MKRLNAERELNRTIENDKFHSERKLNEIKQPVNCDAQLFHMHKSCPLCRHAIVTRVQFFLFLVCDQGSLVGLRMQDYLRVCVQRLRFVPP